MNSMATFGIVKVIECSDSGRMESEQHHGSMAELIVDHQ
jgi:hypothetical protein